MNVINDCNKRLDGKLKPYAASWAVDAALSSIAIALVLDRLPGPLRLGQPFNRKVFYVGTAVGFTLMIASWAGDGLESWLLDKCQTDFTDPIDVGVTIMVSGLLMAGLAAATSNRPLFAGVGAFVLGLETSISVELVLSPIYLVWSRKEDPVQWDADE